MSAGFPVAIMMLDKQPWASLSFSQAFLRSFLILLSCYGVWARSDENDITVS